jgi:hypothetical protein
MANSWYNAHSTHCMRFFWFCCASLVEKVSAVIFGQSSRKSKSRSRILVRNSATFDGPVDGVVEGCEGGGGFNVLEAGIRRLLPLDTEIFALIAAKGRNLQSPKGHDFG